jgi:hypothetical protein
MVGTEVEERQGADFLSGAKEAAGASAGDVRGRGLEDPEDANRKAGSVCCEMACSGPFT